MGYRKARVEGEGMRSSGEIGGLDVGGKSGEKRVVLPTGFMTDYPGEWRESRIRLEHRPKRLHNVAIH